MTFALRPTRRSSSEALVDKANGFHRVLHNARTYQRHSRGRNRAGFQGNRSTNKERLEEHLQRDHASHTAVFTQVGQAATSVKLLRFFFFAPMAKPVRLRHNALFFLPPQSADATPAQSVTSDTYANHLLWEAFAARLLSSSAQKFRKEIFKEIRKEIKDIFKDIRARIISKSLSMRARTSSKRFATE